MGGAAVGEETGPGPGEEEVGDGEGEGEGVADGGEEEFAAKTCTCIFMNPLSEWPGTPQMKPKYPDLTKAAYVHSEKSEWLHTKYARCELPDGSMLEIVNVRTKIDDQPIRNSDNR
ncbi:hypothetical protein AXG93_3658s1190 [Marchantia polymorpha subsp. ruderalis]|uniref:Uncharacterized protein n=1 Tax=Marchantia polymorpha subsp. ruderalis TaxID=1480154 RepID=A0A176VLF4_MARPO|nr:hypothetical protein AXG93_3658s1190 [Marchantia polymorpha subsp. ruderalis]